MAKKNPIIEVLKFVGRIIILVGLPAVLGEVVKQRPQYGAGVGMILLVVDKTIHELPNEYKGLMPF